MAFGARVFGCGLAVASGLLCAVPARGVILYPSATRNGAPSADSIAYTPWQLQGQFGSFLGTPIAPNYFVTATHIGSASSQFVYQGISYRIDGSFGTNGRTTIAGSDLAVWKIAGEFQSYAPLYTGSDEVGQHIVVIGRGTQRGDEVIVRDQLRGWLWGSGDGVQSWGENDVSGIGNGGAEMGDLLQFDFDAGNLPNECTLSVGDSGGGVFIRDNGVWKLAGINASVGGPFSRSRLGTDPFLAALFDQRGLFVQVGQDTWKAGFGPSAAYASRISPRASSIYSLAPGCPVVQQDYAVSGQADMGNIDVAGTSVVGTVGQPADLRANYIRGGTLKIETGSRVTIKGNGTGSGTSRLSGLSIAEGGQFDLTNNDLIIQASASTREAMLDQVTELIAGGRNGGSARWTGSGITSSTAAGHSLTGLAVILNDSGSGMPIFSTFDGQAVDQYCILVKYTWNGDVNLDGMIDAADYFLIDSGYITQQGGYRNGDLNFDGMVDAADYFLVDSAYIGQTGVLGKVPATIVVPEAAGTSLLIIGCLSVLRRHRR